MSKIVVPDAASRYEHGTYARYTLAKCRCLPCTDAARDYEAERVRAINESAPWYVDSHGIVSATGFKTLRVVHRLTREVDGTYVIDVEDIDSTRYIPAQARRRANYLNDRDGVPRPNELIDAELVREQIAKLRAASLGLKLIASRAGIAPSTLARIVGHKTGYRPIMRTRRDVLDAVLSVVPEPQGTVKVDAAPTWKRIDDLLSRGWTRGWISQAIGNSSAALQMARDRQVTAKQQKRIRILHDELAGLVPAPRAVGTRWAFDPPAGLPVAHADPRHYARIVAGEAPSDRLEAAASTIRTVRLSQPPSCKTPRGARCAMSAARLASARTTSPSGTD
jgi:hypothetical protein